MGFCMAEINIRVADKVSFRCGCSNDRFELLHQTVTHLRMTYLENQSADCSLLSSRLAV